MPKRTIISITAGVFLLIPVIICRQSVFLADFYSCHIYPVLSAVLSKMASVVPFSLQEIVIVTAIVLLISIPVMAVKRKWGTILCILREAEIVLWLVVWLYWGWGMNYFRSSIYARTDTTPEAVDTVKFKSFLYDYIDALNSSYTQQRTIDESSLELEVKEYYSSVPSAYGLLHSYSWQHPKKQMFAGLYTSVGVLGYIGPAFVESHVNPQIPALNYPYTYAHEYSHVLGVSSEAEANFWAYQACVHSSDSLTRYSGYYNILVHIWNNAAGILDSTEFNCWKSSIRPEILADLYSERCFWKENERLFLSKVQSFFYDRFLKSNKVPGGMNNYSAVVGMVMTFGEIPVSCSIGHGTISQDEAALRDYITKGMPLSVREMHEEGKRVIPLPYPYSVPCVKGAFQEMYYWDTYYTNEGLLLLEDIEQAKNNVEDIFYMVNKFGYMPNGSSKGLLNRSQSPYFALMVRSIYERIADKDWLARMYKGVEKEYFFWMTQRIAPNGLNRCGHNATDEYLIEFYRDITRRLRCDRSAEVTTLADTLKAGGHWLAEAESWDFNPRYDQRCMDFNPVDLNAQLYILERDMAWFSDQLGNGRAAEWNERADKRRDLIQKYCFNPEDGLFYDYDFVNGCRSSVLSGGVFNLMFAGIMTDRQAAAMKRALPRLEMEHGVVACEECPIELTYQWAYPNVWAPVNYMAICGMDRYGFRKDARRLARKYLDSNVAQFNETGVLWEKYNALTGRNDAASEYGTPGDFMGWTAATVLFTMNYLYGKL